jgi:hypothetical protein
MSPRTRTNTTRRQCDQDQAEEKRQLSQLSQLSPSPSSSARSRTNMCTRLAGWPRPWRSLWRGGPVAARVVALPNQGSDESRTADAMHRKVPRKTTRLQAGNALVGDVFGCAARKPALHQGRAARVHHCEEAAQSTVAGRQSVQVRLHALGVLEQVLRGRRITGQPHAIHHRSQIASSDLSGAPTPRQRRPPVRDGSGLWFRGWVRPYVVACIASVGSIQMCVRSPRTF